MSSFRSWLGTLLLAILACASSATGQEITLRDPSIKADQFPKVELRFRLRVPSAGVFAADMRPSVAVQENGTWKPLQLASEPDQRRGRYLFAIDTSGSMRSSLPKIKGSIQELVRALPADSEISLVTFNDGADIAVPFTKDRATIHAAIDALKIGGTTTELNYGLIRGSELLNSGGVGTKNVIVAFSDGKDEGRAYSIEAVIDAAKVADTRIFAVGVAAGSNSRDLMTMRRIAESTGGRYRDFDSAGELSLQSILAPTVEDFWWTTSWETSMAPDGSRQPVDLQVAFGSAKRDQQLAVQAPLSTFHSLRQSRWVMGLLIVAIILALVFVALKQREVRKLVEANTQRSAMDLEARVKDVKESVRAAVAEGGKRFMPDKTIVESPRARKTVAARGVRTAEAFLQVTQGPREGARFELTRPITTLGRDLTNDICLPEGRISSTHARIVREASKYFIEDLNSTNGTFVDGQRITQRVELAAGTVLRMGGASLKFEQSG